MAVDIFQPNPVPVAKDDLNPHRDFCATLVDSSLSMRDIPITKLIVTPCIIKKKDSSEENGDESE